MKRPRPISLPIEVQITPRLLAAVEGSIGRRLSPGCKVMVVPPPPPLDEIHMTKQDLVKMAKRTTP
jgi:hypothetical protein